MEPITGPLEKNYKKTIDINRVTIFQKSGRKHPFWLQRKEESLEELKVEPVDEKLRRYK
jgi:hypothetical protein